MDEVQRKALLKETFDTVSKGYDGDPLRFFAKSAEQMALLMELRGDEQVLDVACGTGHTSLAFASRLRSGKVTAVDFSAGMLEQARTKALSRGVGNIDFLERDMTALGFPGDSFDAAICAFGIFFVDDMDRQLSHMASQVKPGGRVMISNFQEDYFHPLREMLMSRLVRMGVQMPQQAWKRIANEAGCRELFGKAGLRDVQVQKKNVGYYLENTGQWWDIVWNAGFRRVVGQLAPGDQERFKEEHLKEVEALRTDKGIWLDVGVLYTTGVRPGKD